MSKKKAVEIHVAQKWKQVVLRDMELDFTPYARTANFGLANFGIDTRIPYFLTWKERGCGGDAHEALPYSTWWSEVRGRGPERSLTARGEED
jgi:hypothetical protein